MAEIAAIARSTRSGTSTRTILEEVTKALPDYTWLVSFQTMAADLRRHRGLHGDWPAHPFSIGGGATPDLSAYTRFVSQLATSPWCGNTEFGRVQSVLEDERPVSRSRSRRLRTADSAYIRLAPIQGIGEVTPWAMTDKEKKQLMVLLMVVPIGAIALFWFLIREPKAQETADLRRQVIRCSSP